MLTKGKTEWTIFLKIYKKLLQWDLRTGLYLFSFKNRNQIKQLKMAYAQNSLDCQTSFKVKVCGQTVTMAKAHNYFIVASKLCPGQGHSEITFIVGSLKENNEIN